MTAFAVFFVVAVVVGIIAVVAGIARGPKGIKPAAVVQVPVSGTCLGCQGPLSSLGTEAFRVGGTAGGWKLLFGEWAELGEDKLPLDVYACQQCRRVELRVPASS
ncbi:MAG: hypothetical protein ACXVQY_02545 [Actinomycetota bacterium]